MKHIPSAFFIVFFSLFFLNNVFADPYTNPPGVRARSMGGAFAAVADDSSCFWHNPAGMAIMNADKLASNERIFDMQFSTFQSLEKKPDVENINYAINRKHKKFSIKSGDFGFSFGGREPNLDDNPVKSGGLYYAKPYFINNHFSIKQRDNKPIVNSAFGEVYEEIYAIGLLYGFTYINKEISYGFTIDYINIKSNYSNIWTISSYDEVNNELNYKYIGGDGKTFDAFTGSVGILYKPFKKWFSSYQFSIGSVYRFPSHCREIGPFSDQLIIERPSSMDLGMAVNRISIGSRFIFSVQYGLTEWSRSNRNIDTDYHKYSAGMEWILPNKFIQQKRFPFLSFRTGSYQSKASQKSDNWPDVTSLAFGVGLITGTNKEKNAIEITLENKIIDHLHYEKENHFLLSIAFSFNGISVRDEKAKKDK